MTLMQQEQQNYFQWGGWVVNFRFKLVLLLRIDKMTWKFRHFLWFLGKVNVCIHCILRSIFNNLAGRCFDDFLFFFGYSLALNVLRRYDTVSLCHATWWCDLLVRFVKKHKPTVITKSQINNFCMKIPTNWCECLSCLSVLCESESLLV